MAAVRTVVGWVERRSSGVVCSSRIDGIDEGGNVYRIGREPGQPVHPIKYERVAGAGEYSGLVRIL